MSWRKGGSQANTTLFTTADVPGKPKGRNRFSLVRTVSGNLTLNLADRWGGMFGRKQIKAPIDWQAKETHTIAFAWDVGQCDAMRGSGSLWLHLDGKLAGSLHAGNISMAGLSPEFTLGPSPDGMTVEAFTVYNDIRIVRQGIAWKPSLAEESTPGILGSLVNGRKEPVKLTVTWRVRDLNATLVREGRGNFELPPDGHVTIREKLTSGRYLADVTVHEGSASLIEWSDAVRVVVLPEIASPRKVLNLDENWEVQFADKPTFTPPSNEKPWRKVSLPHVPWVVYKKYTSNKDGPHPHAAWYRRRLRVLPALKGKRLTLHFESVYLKTKVLINGREAGTHYGPFMPFEVDITPHLRPDGENEIMVGVIDYLAAIDKSGKTSEGTTPFLLSAGGRFTYGPSVNGHVRLVCTAPAKIDRARVQSSWRRKEIRALVDVSRPTGTPGKLELRATVYDDDKPVLKLPPKKLTGKGRTAQITLAAPWPNPKPWFPESPKMYALVTELTSGGRLIDSHTVRFGFREVWTEGPNIVVNGAVTHLRMNGLWAMDIHNLMQYRREGNNTVLWHLNVAWPQHSASFDLFDEAGFYVHDYGFGPRSHTHTIGDRKFLFDFKSDAMWGEYRRYLLSRMTQLANHPSVIGYATADEVLQGGHIRAPWAKRLADIQTDMRRFDPTRLVFNSGPGDGDLFGTSSIHDLHYVVEPYRKYSNAVPNVYHWPAKNFDSRLDKRLALGIMADVRWRWKRDKPLHLYHTLSSANPIRLDVLTGELAYADPRAARKQYKRDSAVMCTEAYRAVGVSSIMPWLVRNEPAVDKVNQPVVALVTQYGRNFFTGESASRVVAVINDTPWAGDFLLKWTVALDKRVTGSGEKKLRLDAGEIHNAEVRFTVPKVSRRSDFTWRFEVLREGRKVFEDERTYRSTPRPRAKSGTPVLLYDGTGSTGRMLNDLGVLFRKITTITPSVLKGARTVVIGSGSADVRVRLGAHALRRFASEGGTVVLMRQSSLLDTLPVAITVDESHDTTLGWSIAAGHPVLAGIDDNDLRFWQDDHFVSRADLVLPVGSGGV